MSTSHPRPGRTRVAQVVATLVATFLLLLASSAVASAQGTGPTATISSATLHSAISSRMSASHALKHEEARLRACKRTPGASCAGLRRLLHRAQKHFANADRRVRSLTAEMARTRTTYKTPTSTSGKGPTLIGKLPVYSNPPTSTKTEPAPNPEPAPSPEPTPAPEPTPTPVTSTKSAPKISISGQTVTWSATSGVSSYVFVRKVPGQSDQYSTVASTSTTPAVVPGDTVRFSVRTNVTGSEWAPEVTITYPSSQTGSSAPSSPSTPSEPSKPTEPSTPSTPTEPSKPSEPSTPSQPSSPAPETGSASSGTGSFTMGVVAGSSLEYERPFLEKLGAHTARMQVSINTPASQIASTVEAYAKAGIQPLLLAVFSGRIPSAEEARNVATWAAEFGPKGTLWKGKSFPTGTAVTHIEFGNETSYTYQFSNNSTSEYAARAQSYAIRAKEASEAIATAEPGVGLIIQGDSGGLSGNPWVSNMFKAVPNLGQYAAGWSVHPYGTEGNSKLESLVSATAAAGASSSIPIYVTEWGLDTDNGRCLEYNYGWNKCMTYEEAASTLSSAVSSMRSRYGSRLAAIYLYQAHDQKATGTSTELEAYFGALQSNGSPKGAYTTEVESLLSTNP